MPASAGQSLDVGLHQQLQDALGHSKQKVTVAGLLQKLIQWHQWRALGTRGASAGMTNAPRWLGAVRATGVAAVLRSSRYDRVVQPIIQALRAEGIVGKTGTIKRNLGCTD